MNIPDNNIFMWILEKYVKSHKNQVLIIFLGDYNW